MYFKRVVTGEAKIKEDYASVSGSGSIRSDSDELMHTTLERSNAMASLCYGKLLREIEG